MNIESLKKGKNVKGNSGGDHNTPPDWMDMERFRRGQQFFQHHMGAILFALHCALTVGFVVPRLIKPLVFTNNSDTGRKAILRYMKTFIHLMLWHTQDIWDSDTQAYKSIQNVRGMHDAVRTAMESKEPDETHISQYDLTVVQYGFLSTALMHPSGFGVKHTKRDLEDYVFFWRGMGHLLGLRDEFNLCSGGYDEFYEVGKVLERQILFRGMCDPPKDYELLANAYIDGVNSLLLNLKVFTKESISAFAFKNMELPFANIKLSWIDHLRIMLYRVIVFAVRWVPGAELLFNIAAKSLFKIGGMIEYNEILAEKGKVLNNVYKSGK